ncbi:enoyl-CoA hydratase/isomerase family protein [Polynucleobacter sp. JS-Fieb-80-E5]|jgi:enoyl-CoA hydratase/carnithine racemase|uniref:enoyl-CoA hydratase/isomerase family protein n=1 Tax=Polynucleobacter sp. JS-Fieb-80-E5 TaxID=2081050 RepID=UPI001C0C6D9A|nr:enoyl-CoA hydratase/isomerase family protein [Polynucleobacter sp. JS-Fieb-80-E5]MBU3619392.1 enoyl-CoA hydratase/isomerase family protein [Polynucleobacter sp. JS-Fieb-80-E5]
MNYECIDLKIKDGVALIFLNRPNKRNALNDQIRHELLSALDSVSQDEKIYAVILSGNGASFCAGGDIDAMAKRLELPVGEIAIKGWRRHQEIQRMMALIHNMPKPMIAAVNGAAFGLGADLALACDFIIASENASFCWSYIDRAVIPDGGGMYFLPRRVGLSLAKDLIYSGRRLECEEAIKVGIVDRYSASGDLMEAAEGWAITFKDKAKPALMLGKHILNKTFESSLEEMFSQSNMALGICFTSVEHRTSVENFLNK